MAKISIIGAGNVGSMLAERVLAHDLADVVLVDIAEGLAKAKAFDLTDASPIMGYRRDILGSESYEETRGSAIVVITAGSARKPGMSRDDLIKKNSAVARSVLASVRKYAPEAIIVIVTNPLDIITYLAYKEIGCSRRKILGMAGTLDSARFVMAISQKLKVEPDRIDAIVLGTHGDTMVPLVSRTRVKGEALDKVLDKESLDELIARTKKRGGEILGLLRSGSAYFSPSASCFSILKAIINDERRVLPCSCVLEGEYGIDGCALGVPAKIGKDGIIEIVEWDLAVDELGALRSAAKTIKGVLSKM
ncbi:MAG: malate dehydrogenase [Candidatus Omnitrophota bacterium]